MSLFLSFKMSLLLVVEITDDNTPKQTLVGLRRKSFKNRFDNHKCPFKDLTKNFSTDILQIPAL